MENKCLKLGKGALQLVSGLETGLESVILEFSKNKK